MTAINVGMNDNGGATGSAQSVPQFLPEGFVACPYCNRHNQISLIDVYTAVDEKVYPNSGLPNVYVVSTLKCKSCGLKFDLPRVDVRFGLKRGE